MSKKSIFYTTADLNFPDVQPTLDLNFVKNQKVPPFINVVRNSSATYVDKFGILRTAGVNQPVFEWDPITGKCLGARIWGVVTNHFIRSEELATTWTVAGASVTSNAGASPAGTATADKLQETATTGEHRITQTSTGGATSSAVTLSVFVKPVERTFIRLAFSALASWSGGGGAAAIFNLASGTATADASTPTAFGIAPYANGFYRCWITGTPTVSLTPIGNIFLHTGVTGSYSGVDGNGVLLFGGQLNPGLIAPYVPTTTTAASSTADAWSITGADLARIVNTAEGTLYVEHLAGVGIASRRSISLNDGTSGNNIQLIASNGAGTSANYLEIVAGGSTQATLGTGTAYTSGIQKGAVAYRTDDIAFSRNGGSVLTDSTATIPAVDRLEIGAALAVSPLNGYIRQLKIFPKRLTNSQLIQLTE